MKSLYILLVTALIFIGPGINGLKADPCKCASHKSAMKVSDIDIKFAVEISPVNTCCCTKQVGDCDIKKDAENSQVKAVILTSTFRIHTNSDNNSSFSVRFHHRSRAPDIVHLKQFYFSNLPSIPIYIQNSSLLC